MLTTEQTRFGLRAIVTAMLANAALMAISTPGLARDYVVNTDSDKSASAVCTLHDAIAAADKRPVGGSSCDAPGDGNDSITFESSLSGATIVLAGELPTITDARLSITGPENGITIDGSKSSGTVLSTSIATLALNLASLKFDNAQAGVLSVFGVPPNHVAVTVTNCTFSNNKAAPDGLLSLNTFQDATADLTVSGSSFLGNSAQPRSGIGIIWSRSKVTIDTTTFSGNTGDDITAKTVSVTNSSFLDTKEGSGINGGQTVSVDNSVFSNNVHGISTGLALQVTNSTFSDNTDTAIAILGISHDPAQQATQTIINSTFSGNAGAISNAFGIVVADFCTFLNNANGPIPTLNNYITSAMLLRGDILAAPKGATNCQSTGSLQDRGYNIATDDSCPSGSTSQNGADPMLDPAGLQKNGGPTPTIALLSGSPAATAIPKIQCRTEGPDPQQSQPVTTDQRGYQRPSPNHPDFCSEGAYEYDSVPSGI